MAANRPARERFEFSLDARQVAAVILGSLGLLAATFYIGYAMGHRVVGARPPPVQQAAPPPPAPADPLAALDQPPRPAAPEAAQKLSYHEALTSPKPPAETLPSPAPAPKAVPPATAQVPEPRAAVQPPAAAPALSQAPQAPAVPAARPAAPKPAASPAPPPRASQAPVRGAFTVQVGASPERSEADRIAARFAGRGAKVVAADVPGKGRFYRVRVGSFDTRDAAERYLREMERMSGAKGFVTSAQ